MQQPWVPTMASARVVGPPEASSEPVGDGKGKRESRVGQMRARSPSKENAGSTGHGKDKQENGRLTRLSNLKR